MLEGLVASLLNRFLGAYNSDLLVTKRYWFEVVSDADSVKNFDPKQLNIGIWSGDVKLRKLELKREALDKFRLPIDVVEGHLGELTLQIPWSNLKNKPVKIFIENVYLLAIPKANQEYDEAEEERRKQMLKLERLEDAELLLQAQPSTMTAEEQKKNQSFTESLVTKIIDNLQITVKNIHFRYEDTISAPGHPFALGITLAEFSAVSADEAWNPIFIQDNVLTTHKLSKLENLAMYWNTDSEMLSERSELQSILDAFSTLIPHDKILSGKAPPHQYVLKPVSGQGRITIHKGSISSIANSKAELFFDEIGFVLDEYQYRDALMMVDLFHFYIRTEQFKNLRPKVSVEDGPKQWFRFAGNVVLREIHEKRRQWSWAFFKERRDDRKRYIELYKIKVLADPANPLTSARADELKALEWKLSLEDIRFYRTLAKSQLRKERRKPKMIAGAKAADTNQQAPAKRGWWDWAWGSAPINAEQSSRPSSPTKEMPEDSAVMTDQQRKELYDAIEWDEERKPSADVLELPRDAVKLQLKVSLTMGSFALKNDPHGAATEILKLLFDTFSMNFLQRPDSFLVDLSLQELKVHDGTTQGSLYPDIVRSKTARPGIGHPQLLDIEPAEDDGQPENNPVFFLTFESNPLDESADSRLTLKMGSMEIYYNKTFIEEIVQFFKPPKTHMESFGALLYAAGATVEGITNQTRAGLEYALQEHKTLNAKLDLQAPLLILPSSVIEHDAPCLVLDAGHISMVSNLVDKSTIREVQNKQSTQYREDDYKALMALMYDKFQLNLESTQVLVGPSVEETIDQLYNTSNTVKHFHIVDRINMTLLVEISILPNASNLTKFRVSGHLPVLHVSMSDVKYKILMHLINSSIPNLSFSDPDVDSRIEELEMDFGSPARPKASREGSNNSSQPSRPSAFTFRSQPDLERVVEINDFIDADDEDDDDDDTFVEAEEGSSGSVVKSDNRRTRNGSADISYEQRTFEFNFTVDRVQGSLYRGGPFAGGMSGEIDDDFSKSHLLVDVILDHFELMFYSRAFDMHAEVILGKLNVEDRIEENPNPEFGRLISSDSYYDTKTSQTDLVSKESNLFHIKYSKVAKESPEYLTVFEGIDQNVEVSISTLNFVITRKSILTLLDFLASTFSSPNDADDEDQIIEVDESSDSETEIASTVHSGSAPDKMKLKLNLSSIVLVLNDDGVRLATVRFDQADVGIFSMGKTMRVGARLGNFTLHDHMSDEFGESVSNQLVSIQGEELADFRYETFDPNSFTVAYPGYNASVYFRSGSIKVNFVDESVKRILQFLAKFAEMKTLYDSAREVAVNQASQMKDPDKIRFDVIVRTPILVFSRDCLFDNPEKCSNVRTDVVTVHLGEMYIQNSFSTLENGVTGRSTPVNKIHAGIRQTRITSVFHFPEDVVQELQMIENLDITFKMVYVEHTPGVDRPALEIVGSMSDVNLILTESQYIFFISLMKSFSTTFQAPPPQEDEAAMNMRRAAVSYSKDIDAHTRPRVHSKASGTKVAVGRTKEEKNSKIASTDELFTKMDFVFRLQTLALELFNDTDGETITSTPASLSKLALTGTDTKMRMKSDDSIEAEFHIKSFTIYDSRQSQKNKFRKIVPPIQHDGYQFMASISAIKNDSGAQDVTAILSIDSPRFIFAIDYIFALKAYFLDSLQTEDDDVNRDVDDLTDSDSTLVERSSDNRDVATENEESAVANVGTVSLDVDETPALNISFRVNVVDASVILIANPLTPSSEAIVLRIKEIMMAQQNVFTLITRQVGIYLCRMDLFEENRLRILDDFNLILSIDNNSGGIQHKMSINIGVDSLVLRLSLRDILLALSIVHRAAELSPEQRKPIQKRSYSRFSSNKRLKLQARRSNKSVYSSSRALVSGDNRSDKRAKTETAGTYSALLKNEELTADFDGLRLVLIGGVHELPLLDMCIKQFPFHFRNWSTEMDADTSVEMFINVYNYSKSAWEPLMEPWYLGFHMTRTVEPENLSINFSSRKTLELTVTSQTIAMLSNSIEMMSGDSDLLSRPPDANAPYRIKNQTGYTLQVWVDNVDNTEYAMAKEIADGEEVPWRFDDWRKLRENLNEDSQHGTVGVRLKDTNFDAVTRIQANKEGEALYVLQPKTMKVAHRLICEVKLREDKVKHITFRSAMLVENNTQIPIDMLVGDPNVTNTKIMTIVPGESQAVPIEQLFDQTFKIRPGVGLGFQWCEETLYWRTFMQKYSPYLTCKSEVDDGQEDPAFYFQVHAIYDVSEPLTRLYPHMRIRISAPIEVQNLLPYDFTYKIYDKNIRQEWSNFLRKGLLSPIHVVKLSHLLLLSVHMKDSGFERTDFAVINSRIQDEFQKENSFATRHQGGQKLHLRLHYYTIPESGGAFRVSIYSPYIILNKTGMDIQIKAGSVIASSQFSSEEVEGDASKKRAIPKMFSYVSDDRSNRASLRVGNSMWSRPQSFEAIGGNTDAVITSNDRNREIHVGIHVSEGQGKYKMTKIVSISPRFILKNKLSEDLNIREPGSSMVMAIKAGEVLPLHFMQQVPEKQLTLSFPMTGAPWSAPFNISDLGRTHVKVVKPGEGQKLLKIEILIEQATIFLHIDVQTSNWPYSIRNFSNTEFTFYQANPYITYDDDEDMTHLNNGKRFRPIVYRLPRKSVMPYAWDYPAASQKELVICAHGAERHVPLAEIGNLVPMKLPVMQNGQPVTIDINVVADGPIQTLVLSDYDPSRSLYKPKYNMSQSSFSSSTGSTSSLGGFEVVEDDGDITFRAVVNLEGIGISLVNTRMQELCYITFRGFEVKYNESAIYQTLSTKLKWIQIDNELFGGIYPIILYPSVLPQTAKEMENHPTLSASITRVKDDSHGVLYVKYATILLQQMTVEIDEDFLFALLDFSKVPGASWTSIVEDKLCDDELNVPEPEQSPAGRDVYFEVLHIQPAQMDLSFVRTERVNVEDKTSSQNAIMFFLNILTMAIGNINDAPVQLNALVLENARVSLPMLAQLMATHYGQQFLFQVHNILGSADFLGNPVGLFNNLSSGVMDIFYEPYQGFIMTDRPQELGIGLAKGGLSFLKKSVFGVSDSIAKVTGSISKGLAVATLDKQFQDRRRISRVRNRPKHALYGVTAGANSFVEGLASGISGMALAPMKGASEEGAAGFFKGLGKGLVGLPTKTAIGLFDLASNVSEGIRNTTTVFDAQGIDRVRLPRFIGRDKVVKPYNQREAIGQAWLKQLNEGDYFNEEYVAHMSLPGEELVVIVTYTRILLMHTRRMTAQWDVQFDKLQTVSMEKGGIALILWGGIQGPFIPIADDSARQFLYNKIGLAVEEYNQYRQAQL
ncbi:hypothetical protein POJ06DRAFT_300095 [Lipomyces tetrasporus]|uniref:Vacuolar protein sorting-associated protein n=1 Tax=Lipomyces tetrasporus TaxID=54092 RepID=A0AAD7QVP6_9ASCO|nr:uncharacterized protein POJ06DRAFT_300095 [Lipomyces tetrasporus]KAJ8102210.1 hypothetical protein POJ06DRAFT_300095 [Lipomyces tetrasporus]